VYPTYWAVSSQDEVLVATGALMLAWLLGVSRWIGELGAPACIGGYLLAVGPQPSVGCRPPTSPCARTRSDRCRSLRVTSTRGLAALAAVLAAVVRSIGLATGRLARGQSS
jgi:hypothetical protein